ncbi:mical2b, partial [Symbiodinium pilosum]
MDDLHELLSSGRRLLRFLDANHDGLLSVEECQHLKDDQWLFPSEDIFLQVLDPNDSEFVDADALWHLLSDRLQTDPSQGGEWLKGQLPSVKRLFTMRCSKSRLMDSPTSRSARGSPSPARSMLRSAWSPTSLEAAWEDFCQALQITDITEAFSKLCSHLTGEPPDCSQTSVILYERLLARLPSVSIPRLDRQRSSGGYPLQDARLGVVGAGPIGLRAAFELALLGAKVQVFDVRDGFYRMNILKLWDWASADLLDLGAKFLLPNFLTYIDHIGIRELQSLLLKLGLLAGVQYTWGASFKDVAPSPSNRFLQVTTQKASVDAAGHRTLGSDEIHNFAGLVACDGGNSRVAAQLGLQRVRADGLSTEPGWEFAVVANFENLKEPEDRMLEECPRGFSQEELSLVKRLIYLQGETHYFIMTVDLDVLMHHHVLRDTTLVGKELLSDKNVDMRKLEDFARKVVEDYSNKVRSLDGIFGPVEIPENFWTT